MQKNDNNNLRMPDDTTTGRGAPKRVHVFALVLCFQKYKNMTKELSPATCTRRTPH